MVVCGPLEISIYSNTLFRRMSFFLSDEAGLSKEMSSNLYLIERFLTLFSTPVDVKRYSGMLNTLFPDSRGDYLVQNYLIRLEVGIE